MHRALLFVLTLLMTAPAPARAQQQDTSHIVILDLTSSAREDRQLIAVPYRAELLDSLRLITTEGQRNTALEKLTDVGTRWISRRGERLVAVVLHDTNTTARIQFDEQARDTRLGSDLVTLAELALRLGSGAESLVPQTILVTEAVYTLRKPRAKLRITGSATKNAAPDSARTTQARAAAPEPAKKAEVTLVTGPVEHLFLSANAGATDASALKYDDDSNSLQLEEAPTGFFIGINYSFGDILSDPAKGSGHWFRNVMEGMYVGGALQGSRRPFDQAGVHLGFRYNPVPILNKVLSFETVSPYVGLVWTKNDQVDAAGNRLGERRYGRRELVWGVSLNLDKALGWVGGGGK